MDLLLTITLSVCGALWIVYGVETIDAWCHVYCGELRWQDATILTLLLPLAPALAALALVRFLWTDCHDDEEWYL